jgi:hypothetical protein
MAGVDALLQHIQFRLASRKFCILSERELKHIGPPGKKRSEAIQALARANNMSAVIKDSGTRVTFKKLPEP